MSLLNFRVLNNLWKAMDILLLKCKSLKLTCLVLSKHPSESQAICIAVQPWVFEHWIIWVSWLFKLFPWFFGFAFRNSYNLCQRFFELQFVRIPWFSELLLLHNYLHHFLAVFVRCLQRLEVHVSQYSR